MDELINGIQKEYSFTMSDLIEIVDTDKKNRYSFNEDQTLIRANQGHSIPVDVELKEAIPPDILYHGTGEKYVNSIDQIGLIPKSRLYVHLSRDVETASVLACVMEELLCTRLTVKKCMKMAINFIYP